MNNVERLVNESKDVQDYAERYLRYLSGLLKNINIQVIASFIEELENARENQNTVFFIGNGGSAATASHMANDLGLGPRLGEDAKQYRTLALTDNVAKMTAVANDFGYDRLFVDQLKLHYRPGDKLVAISASGNSPNIINAGEWVKKRGGTVIGFTGFDGGRLKEISDIVIHVATPKGEYGPVEDIHMVVDHLVYMWLRCKKGVAGAK
jgi:D-sedoheptulose 7-phosphate isomerase